MSTTTSKGIPIPQDGDTFNISSADDGSRQGDLERLAAWLNEHPGTQAVTTVQRNALVAPDVWPGKVIFNLTTGQLEQNATGVAGAGNWASAAPGLVDGAVTTAKLADGAVTNPKLADSSVTDAKVAAANKDGAAATPSMRTLGSGAQQAAAGNDARLFDQRTPTDGSVTDAKVAAANKDGAAGTPSMRTLGGGGQQAAAGDHTHPDLAPKASPTFSGTTTIGTADTDVEKVRAIAIETHTRSSTPTYDATTGNLTKVMEKAGATTVKTTTYAYTGDQLTTITIVVALPGGGTLTITKTLSYDAAGNYTGTTRSVA